MSTYPTIAVASGKGGTGKTTVATSLATAMQQYHPVTLIDCDVEEPNAHLLLGVEFSRTAPAEVASVKVDSTKCDGCGQCATACRFNAIAATKQTGALYFAELCHGCMGCLLACPQKAITEIRRQTGVLRFAEKDDLHFVSGLLNVGEAMATGVIAEARNQASNDRLTVLDAPPGTSCPMLATVGQCDYVVLVTEPTPFGLNDLNLAVDALRELKQDFGVVVNRADAADTRIDEFCRRENINILTQIPDSLAVAESYSRGQLPYGRVEEFTAAIDILADTMRSKIATQEVSA